MGKLIVIEFTTLDGVVENPDADTGTFLLGRTTWELFAKIWPGRTDEFSTKMNAIPKLVASRSLATVDTWQNSSLLTGELSAEVRRRTAEQDLIMTGSVSVVHELARQGLVDEYRLMVFPVVLGTGRRLFAGDTPAELRLTSVKQKGAGALLHYAVER
jgi:dihydrofolate reductase